MPLPVQARSFQAERMDNSSDKSLGNSQASQIVVRVPHISAETACLIDVASGRILYGQFPDKRMRIASLTKIVTAWIAVRSGKWNDVVTVSDHAVKQEGSSVYLEHGEKQTLRNLTYAMMLRSGNDAAMAIAEYLGGSSEHFSEIMNHEVQNLGAIHSHFTNPHGLDNELHYSTARDMALITATALHNPTFAQIVKTKYYAIPWEGKTWDRKLKNKNKLLWQLPGASGVKTGYTKKSGRCLVSALTRDGHQVVAVVLRDGSDWEDSTHLLTYGIMGFDRHNVVDLVSPGDYKAAVRWGQQRFVRIVPKGVISYPLRAGEAADIEIKPVRIQKLAAPIRVGQRAGEAAYYLNGQKLGTVPLTTVESVRAKGLMGRLREWVSNLSG